MKIIREARRLVEINDEANIDDINVNQDPKQAADQIEKQRADANPQQDNWKELDVDDLKKEYYNLGYITTKEKMNQACDITTKALNKALGANPKTSPEALRKQLGDDVYYSFVDKNLKWDQLKQHDHNEFINMMKKYDMSVMNRDQLVDLYNAYTNGYINSELIQSSNTLADLTTTLRQQNDEKYKAQKNRTSDQVLNDVADELIQSHLDKQINDLKDVIKAKMDAKKNANNA